jgi:hypothetical protein
MDHRDGPTTASAQEFADTLAEPVVVLDRHLDVVAANRIAGAVSASLTVGTNLARFTFLNPYVEESADDWEEAAHRTAAMLRDSLEQHDEDPRFRELVGELMARSPAFATEWAGGDRGPVRRGVTTFENPLVGRVVLRWEQLRRVDDHEHVLVLWAPVDDASARHLDELRALLGDEPADRDALPED